MFEPRVPLLIGNYSNNHKNHNHKNYNENEARKASKYIIFVLPQLQFYLTKIY